MNMVEVWVNYISKIYGYHKYDYIIFYYRKLTQYNTIFQCSVPTIFFSPDLSGVVGIPSESAYGLGREPASADGVPKGDECFN